MHFNIGGRARASESLVARVKSLKQNVEVLEYLCDQCRRYGRGILDPRYYDNGVLETFVICATDFLKRRPNNGRIGEPQAVRIKRKWCARVTQVQKVLNDGSNALAARIWQDFCGHDSTEPDECDTVFLSTFMRQYEEEVNRLQGTVSL